MGDTGFVAPLPAGLVDAAVDWVGGVEDDPGALDVLASDVADDMTADDFAGTALCVPAAALALDALLASGEASDFAVDGGVLAVLVPGSAFVGVDIASGVDAGDFPAGLEGSAGFADTGSCALADLDTSCARPSIVGGGPDRFMIGGVPFRPFPPLDAIPFSHPARAILAARPLRRAGRQKSTRR